MTTETALQNDTQKNGVLCNDTKQKDTQQNGPRQNDT